MRGTYVLLLETVEPTTVEIGALGDRRFSAGEYAYVGSSLGTGGFARETATANSRPCCRATP